MNLPYFRLKSGLFVAIFLAMVLTSLVGAESRNVGINSKDWKDVYSGTLYAQLNDDDFYFATSAAHVRVLPGQVRVKFPFIVIEPTNNNFGSGLEGLLKSRFEIQETISMESRALRQELGKRVQTKKFVVLDGTYGYNAISVVSYAVREKAWVVFAEDFTPTELKNYLTQLNAENVLRYGPLSAEKKEALTTFPGETIDKGDRFSNNVALLRQLLKEKAAGQLTLTNGEFIERSLIDGPQRDPILLTGSQSVPKVTIDFLNEIGIAYGVLVGIEQSDVARWIKANTPMQYIYVKFAQTIIQKNSPVAEPWALNTMILPQVPLNVNITSIQFNTQTQELEVTFKNLENTRTFLQGEVEVFLGNVSAGVVRDSDVLVLEGQAARTGVYAFDLINAVSGSSNLSANVTGRYGEERGALERQVFAQADNLAIISFLDDTQLIIGALVYDAARQGFEMEIQNAGTNDAFFEPFLRFFVLGEEKNLKTPVTSVKAGETRRIFFQLPLTKEELNALNGEVISASINYGAREAFLVKSLSEDRLFSLMEASVQNNVDWTLVLVAGLILGVGFLAFQRKSNSGNRGFSAKRRWR